MSWLKKLFGIKTSGGDPALIAAVSRHVEYWIGGFTIFHEIVSPTVHVDIFVVAPTEERPFFTLVTSGMAELAMTPPPHVEGCTHAELLMFLPADWPVDSIRFDKRAVRPIRNLKELARYPHDLNTWLWLRHTVQLGDPVTPDQPFVGVMMYFPMLLDPDGGELKMEDGREVTFLCVIYLRPEEIEFVREHSANDLVDLAEESDRLDELLIFDPGRASFLPSLRSTLSLGSREC